MDRSITRGDMVDRDFEDFITVVRKPRQTTKPFYVVELRRFDARQGDGEFTVTQCSEPLGKVEADRLALVWSDFHRLEIR